MANYIQDYLYSELPQELLEKYVKWVVVKQLGQPTEDDLMTIAVLQKGNSQTLYITQEKAGKYEWVEMFKSPVPILPTTPGAYALKVTSNGNVWEEIRLPKDGVGIYNVKIDSEGTNKGHLIITLTNGKKIDAGQTIGEQGIGVEKVTIDSEGDFIVLYTDGTSEVAGTVKGEKGDVGPAGVSVDHASVDIDGNLIIILTDGSVINAGYTLGPRGPEGPVGPRGPRGEDGEEGVGVIDAYIRSDLRLVLILSNGEEIVTDRVVGPQGRTGPEGPQGPVGPEGPEGPEGRGISDVDIDIDGNLRVKYTDGIVENLGLVVGPQGSEGPQGEPGAPGSEGAPGTSIKSAEINSEGILTLTLTDDTPIIVQGRVKGEDGGPGPQGPQGSEGPIGPQGSEGVGIQSASVDSSGDLIVLLSNGSNIDAGRVIGPQGSEGVGIERIDVLLDDHVVIVLTDGRSKDLGVLKGDKGDRGSEGPIGPEGPQGLQGPQGDSGKGIGSISCYYAVSTSQTAPAPESIISTTIPTMTSTLRYLWQKQIISYTDGTTSAPIVLLIGVYGETGATGPQGAAGSQGPAGEQGPAGPQGPAGLQGPQGSEGPQGPIGPQGSEGPMGPQGSEGTSIAAANIASGNLIITLTDGTTVDAGPVIAAPTIPAPTAADEAVALCWNYTSNSMEWQVVKK